MPPIMTTRLEIIDHGDATPLVVAEGRIHFDNISFSYSQAEVVDDAVTSVLVIRNLPLTIAASEKVGVVGLSGAGKSTLISFAAPVA